jgi:hypothetical protein
MAMDECHYAKNPNLADSTSHGVISINGQSGFPGNAERKGKALYGLPPLLGTLERDILNT